MAESVRTTHILPSPDSNSLLSTWQLIDFTGLLLYQPSREHVLPSFTTVERVVPSFPGTDALILILLPLPPCCQCLKVVEIRLPGNNAHGILPPSLGSLSELRTVELRENLFEGKGSSPHSLSLS